MTLLREFDLDLPYKPNLEYIKLLMQDKGLEYLQATQMDYNNTWKDKRILFRDQIRCVCSMYSRLLGKYKTNNCKKVLVECISDVSAQSVRDFSGIYTVEVALDINQFFTSSNYERKKITLQVLKNGIDIVVNHQQWDKKVFDEVYDKVILNDYVNQWVWRKPVNSPTEEYIAEVGCNHEVDFFEVFLIIKDRNGVVLSNEKVLTERPNEFAYAKHLGEIRWLSDNEVALINQNGTQCWSISLKRPPIT